MKSRLLLLLLLSFVTALLLAFSFNEATQTSSTPPQKSKTIIRCGPDWEQLEKYFDETDIPPIEGSGNHTWKISTTSDSAQFYFNQGINMYYSFHIIEGMASFKKAEKFDPASAMIQWAQALAYGPNINDMGYAASPQALAVSHRAHELMASGTEREKLLINAMQVRYSSDSTASREKLNQLYVDRMKDAYTKYPNDADIAALYADALMLQHPWDLWNINGTPKPWTPTIRTVLEKLLARYPNHPGANHYYIHVMEASPYAIKALASADRLGKITPALSHTVHMPSHIYLRTGHYNKGITVNENAVNSYKKVLPLYAPVAGNDFLYVIHNLHMQVNSALMAGRMAYAIETSLETIKNTPTDYLAAPGGLASYMQAIYMLPVITDVRFARWQQLLDHPQPPASQVYANVFYRFGRGMALSQMSKPDEARNELEAIRELIKDPVLQLPFPPFSPAIEGAKVAEKMLEGNIALMEKKYTVAINAFSQANKIEENMIYTEPRDWLLNPKHYLGKAYLLAGQFANAEKTFRKDLDYNNENPWALRGLYQALVAQKKADAGAVLTRFKKASEKADIKITTAAL